MSTYDEDRAEALSQLRATMPTNPLEHATAAVAQATLALAAATRDGAAVTLAEYSTPIDLVPAERATGRHGRHRVYVASSWRNTVQPVIVNVLRAQGHEVYDFRNPPSGTGFSWAEVKPDGARGIPGKGSDWEAVENYLVMIDHPRARQGFEADRAAMQAADTFVLVLPCGKSAHLELGWAVGAGKRTAILLEDPVEPELMYLMATRRFTHVADLLAWLDY